MTIRSMFHRAIGIAALAFLFAAVSLPAPAAQNDPQLQADAQKALKNKEFSDVQINVTGGVVTLTGNVKLYADKEEADNKMHHVKAAIAVRNEIQVAGPAVSDADIYKKLSAKIAWDRIGYNEPPIPFVTPFNAIDVHVNNGIVTLTGHAYGPIDKDSAVSLAEYQPGVKDVIDEVQVDPVSTFDDQTRMAVFRAIYGFPALSQYGADPARPIRITVINGNVILSGVVNNQTDKNLATLRANQVPNVFKVTNDLQIAGRPANTAENNRNNLNPTTNTVTK